MTLPSNSWAKFKGEMLGGDGAGMQLLRLNPNVGANRRCGLCALEPCLLQMHCLSYYIRVSPVP